jgi:hypothetical protein
VAAVVEERRRSTRSLHNPMRCPLRLYRRLIEPRNTFR